MLKERGIKIQKEKQKLRQKPEFIKTNWTINLHTEGQEHCEKEERKRDKVYSKSSTDQRLSNGPTGTVIRFVIIIVSFAMNMFTQKALNVKGFSL